MEKELSVIIVNYNGAKFFKDCLDSLYRNLTGINFEIIVLDNNSRDNSCDYLKSNFPEVKLIASALNYGFGKGNNEAVKQAKGEYLLLINNDTIVLDQLLPVLEYLKFDKSIGVVGINMLNGDKKYLPAAGNFPSVSNMFLMKRLLQISDEFIQGKFTKSAYEVDWLGGSFLMLPKSIYNQIGGFDEDYFLYVEDVDFCKKIADIGYKRVFLPCYSYIHYVGFTRAKNPMLIRGYEIYLSKHYSGIEKSLILLALKINKLVKKIKKVLASE
ncbi:glycosyltransferase family 2 protein [Flavobacterium mekongense]|uniref:glycosyltransferase family 2 protein n=1 Tax=Flavobacterium mekongense TaxID=3379707 RepID=UPI003999E765